MKKITLFEPNIGNVEKKMVLEALNKNQISTYGYFKDKFEKEAKRITKSKYNLATSSGSAALYVAFKAIGVKKDEIVITQSYTFTATTNAIILNNSTPLLLDISLKDMNLDFDQLESFLKKETFQRNKFTFHKKTKKKISCLCLVLTLGIVPDLEKIKYFSKKYKLKIVFDAACAFGHKYKNQKLTNYCDAAIYSFNGSKNLTTGAGGIVSTENYKYYDYAKKFTNNGKIMNQYHYKMIGFNLGMSSLNAAIGLAQVKRFKELMGNKIRIKNFYQKNLSPLKLFKCEFTWGKYLPWMNFILIPNKNKRNMIIDELRKKNVLVSKFWLPMHKQPTKKNFILTDYPNTNYIYNSILVLPSSTFLSSVIIKRISEIIKKKYFNKNN